MKIPNDWLKEFQDAKNSVLKYFLPDQVENVEEVVLPFGFLSFSEKDIPVAKETFKNMSLDDLVQLASQIGLESIPHSKTYLIEEVIDYLLLKSREKTTE